MEKGERKLLLQCGEIICGFISRYLSNAMMIMQLGPRRKYHLHQTPVRKPVSWLGALAGPKRPSAPSAPKPRRPAIQNASGLLVDC
jgi:hypothetical protein